ncbi:secondary thiamine-phosphate synthase enzyme YjbQ [Desulfofarcimen acetoxidans]|jgi:secondary thiamine-phosphate synthase enzyme|nr:secondary thiamine-phosphate synthase enzyme YjbQ [Desulfofarcimen acetoxidans]
MHVLELKTSQQIQFLDITSQINTIINEQTISEGICYIFVPHTTAGITINEHADPSVVKDMIRELNKVIPFNDNYSHLEGNSAAHIKASLMGASQTVFIYGGRLILGSWQGIYFCEFDGPRQRKILLKITGQN